MSNETIQPVGVAPIRITYRESADFVMEALAQVPRPPVQRTFKMWGLILAAMFALIFLQTILEHRSKGTPIEWTRLAFSFGLIAVLAASLLIAFRRWSLGQGALSRRLYRNAYRKRVGREESQVIGEFGEVALFISTEGGVASQYPWTAIVKVIERPKGLLIYNGPQIFHWFPKTAFASETDYASAIRLIQSKVADVQKID